MLRPTRWLLLGCGLLGLSSLGYAFSVVPPTFDALVDEAEQILRIEVTGVSSRWDEAGGNKVIHTYVQCHILRTLKGASQDSITLRLFGGQVGKARMEASDMPSFEMGRHYVVFLKNNGHAFCPLLAVMYGSYRLDLDPATGTERVMRSNGEVLRGTAEINLPLNHHIPADGTHPLGITDSISRDDFESSIVNRLAQAPPK